VHEKAADELGGVERHGLEPVAAFDAVVLQNVTPASSSKGGSRPKGDVRPASTCARLAVAWGA
jgi:hypothetical protein